MLTLDDVRLQAEIVALQEVVAHLVVVTPETREPFMEEIAKRTATIMDMVEAGNQREAESESEE